jgi:hypothetical protein
MRKIGFGLLCWFLMSPVFSVKSQFISHGPNGLTDSAIHAEEDSLERVEFYPRYHHKKGFLANDVAFGGTIGTPGGLNFIAEGYYGRLGLRLEAGAIPLILAGGAGWQTDLSYVLARGSDYLIECSAIYYQSVFTSLDAGETTWYKGLGIGMALDAGGFFLELGIGHTRSVDSQTGFNYSPKFINSIPMTVQIGYVD